MRVYVNFVLEFESEVGKVNTSNSKVATRSAMILFIGQHTKTEKAKYKANTDSI